MLVGLHSPGAGQTPRGLTHRKVMHVAVPYVHRMNLRADPTLLQPAKAERGSWWPERQRWLTARSSAPDSPPRTGAPERDLFVLGDAPGRYISIK